MYTLSEQQINFILNDIKTRGVEMEDLQLNLLDHVCCMIERELEPDGNFDQFYQQLIPKFFKKELKEIEEETILLLTFKNYYAMKKVMITSGVISVAAFIGGSFFKVMHWPGASPLLLLGILIMSFIFLPLTFLLKIKDVNSIRDKLIAGIGTLVGILASLFILFKVMHWPGAGTLGISALSIFFFVFIPVYFFTGIRNTETKLNTTVTTIILIAATGLQFTLINVHPPQHQTETKMHLYLQNEELLKKMQMSSTDSVAESSEKKQMKADINNTAEKLRGLILGEMTGRNHLSKDFEKENVLFEDGNLPQEFEPGRKGFVLFSHLKDAIQKYNASGNEQIPPGCFDNEKIVFYNSFVVLDYLVQTQMYVAASKS